MRSSPVGRSEDFRAAVQPLVRDAVFRGASVNDTLRMLRSTHGRAYRREHLVEDVRRYRELAHASAVIASQRAISNVMSGAADLRRTIARAGVAVFAVTLIVPTIVYDITRADPHVLVADASEVRIAGDAALDVALPNQVAVAPRRAVAEPTPVPTPAPTPVPTPRPLTFVPGGPGVVITASWYGPGFYENRLPCWQWLQANGLPIQFLPDTWGVAHKTLPCGTMLRLTHGANTITVPVVDRGPYVAGRELDLSPRVKAALGCTDLCTVLMQIP